MKLRSTVFVLGALLSVAALAQTPAATDSRAAPKKAGEKAAAQKPKPAGMSDRAIAKQGGPVTVGVSSSANTAANAPTVRDWAAIDINKDNLIGPDEMEQWLQAQWAAAKK
jgi:hypothetical protein